MGRTISFRGMMADNVQETINLHTNDGKIGYRVKSFTGISSAPGTQDIEAVFKIYKTEQDAVDGTVNFSDNRLLGVVYFKDFATNDNAPSIQTIIFDGETFNQDIYITYLDVRSSNSASYYLELEQFSIDLSEQTVATLKDIRNTGTQ